MYARFCLYYFIGGLSFVFSWQSMKLFADHLDIFMFFFLTFVGGMFMVQIHPTLKVLSFGVCTECLHYLMLLDGIRTSSRLVLVGLPNGILLCRCTAQTQARSKRILSKFLKLHLCVYFLSHHSLNNTSLVSTRFCAM